MKWNWNNGDFADDLSSYDEDDEELYPRDDFGSDAE